jgi:hypothetical protein
MVNPTSLACTTVRTSTLPNAEVFIPIRISACPTRLAICATCTGPGKLCGCAAGTACAGLGPPAVGAASGFGGASPAGCTPACATTAAATEFAGAGGIAAAPAGAAPDAVAEVCATTAAALPADVSPLRLADMPEAASAVLPGTGALGCGETLCPLLPPEFACALAPLAEAAVARLPCPSELA